METQMTFPVTYEQKLVGIIRTLPPERVSEVIDFAQFLAACREQSNCSIGPCARSPTRGVKLPLPSRLHGIRFQTLLDREMPMNRGRKSRQGHLGRRRLDGDAFELATDESQLCFVRKCVNFRKLPASH